MKQVLIAVLFIFSVTTLHAQNDSIRVSKKKSKQVLPLSLIGAGALLNIGTIKNQIQDKLPDTHTNMDNYLQYLSMGEIYLFDAMGFKHQNSVFDQTKYLAISQLFSSSLVHFLKQTTKVQRPKGGNTSFPSGHTTNAFVGATVLFHEFRDTEPILAYSGFVFATATGILRMTNDAHWLPDVLVGAGIGILTVNMVYLLEPLKSFQPFKKKKNIVVTPMMSLNSLSLQCRF